MREKESPVEVSSLAICSSLDERDGELSMPTLDSQVQWCITSSILWERQYTRRRRRERATYLEIQTGFRWVGRRGGGDDEVDERKSTSRGCSVTGKDESVVEEKQDEDGN